MRVIPMLDRALKKIKSLFCCCRDIEHGCVSLCEPGLNVVEVVLPKGRPCSVWLKMNGDGCHHCGGGSASCVSEVELSCSGFQFNVVNHSGVIKIEWLAVYGG